MNLGELLRVRAELELARDHWEHRALQAEARLLAQQKELARLHHMVLVAALERVS